jgi:hypothetical protein
MSRIKTLARIALVAQTGRVWVTAVVHTGRPSFFYACAPAHRHAPTAHPVVAQLLARLHTHRRNYDVLPAVVTVPAQK